MRSIWHKRDAESKTDPNKKDARIGVFSRRGDPDERTAYDSRTSGKRTTLGGWTNSGYGVETGGAGGRDWEDGRNGVFSRRDDPETTAAYDSRTSGQRATLGGGTNGRYGVETRGAGGRGWEDGRDSVFSRRGDPDERTVPNDPITWGQRTTLGGGTNSGYGVETGGAGGRGWEDGRNGVFSRRDDPERTAAHDSRTWGQRATLGGGTNGEYGLQAGGAGGRGWEDGRDSVFSRRGDLDERTVPNDSRTSSKRTTFGGGTNGGYGVETRGAGGRSREDVRNGVSSRRGDPDEKTATYDSRTSGQGTTLGGGTGGNGGDGSQNGGAGGRGWAAYGHLQHAGLINHLKGGQGGNGGRGDIDGGPGGVGEGAEFATNLAPFNWDDITVPDTTIPQFCAWYNLGSEIEELLKEGGYQSATTLTMESDIRLIRSNTYHDGRPQFKNGHISEIKRALKQFYKDCRDNRVPKIH